MEINIEDYLSNDELKQIIKDEVINRVRNIFRDETNSTRIISNIGYQIVMDEVDKIIPNAKEIIINNVSKLINEKDYSYLVFSDSPYGKSLAQQLLEQSVRDHKGLLNEKVRETIVNSDYSEEIWKKFEQLSETFISNIYEITRLGKKEK